MSDKIEKGKQLIEGLIEILREIPDSDIPKLFSFESRDDFLKAVLDPAEASKFPSVVEFFFANKNRASLLSAIRLQITLNYSFYAEQNGQKGFCSPAWFQWFDDGVLFLSGEERFSGIIGLYKDSEVKYAIAARSVEVGAEMSADDFEFLTIKDYEELFKTIPPEQISDLEQPIRELQGLLEKESNDESEYQEILQKYPWVLGFQYELVQRHRELDDKNIPDFTAVKVHDKTRDIIEIKPPFAKLFIANGDYSGDFLRDWTQTEKYLNFAREEKDYLQRKGLHFDNPRCYLITGYNVTPEERQKLRIKERVTSAINILTYNELIEYMIHTVEFIKRLKSQT